jgi:hypothetical protein
VLKFFHPTLHLNLINVAILRARLWCRRKML